MSLLLPLACLQLAMPPLALAVARIHIVLSEVVDSTAFYDILNMPPQCWSCVWLWARIQTENLIYLVIVEELAARQ